MAIGALSVTPLLFGAAIAPSACSIRCSPSLGKTTPVAASLHHLVGGALHFLLGDRLAHGVDGRGILLSLFFGLVFAAGHLNQEVRDHDADLPPG